VVIMAWYEKFSHLGTTEDEVLDNLSIKNLEALKGLESIIKHLTEAKSITPQAAQAIWARVGHHVIESGDIDYALFEAEKVEASISWSALLMRTGLQLHDTYKKTVENTLNSVHNRLLDSVKAAKDAIKEFDKPAYDRIQNLIIGNAKYMQGIVGIAPASSEQLTTEQLLGNYALNHQTGLK